MNEMSRRRRCSRVVRGVWRRSATPSPTGLVAADAGRCRAMAGSDLDAELMLLVERSTELAGARGTDGVHAAVRARRDRPAAADRRRRATGPASTAGSSRPRR